MPPDSQLSPLQRMASSAAPPAGDRPDGTRGHERAFQTAALRVGDTLEGLGLSTEGCTCGLRAGAQAFEDLDARALCLVIDPEGMTPAEIAAHSGDTLAARQGLVILDAVLTDALVEVQTVRRVEGPARPGRRPTRIDAALAQPFVAALLDQVGRLLTPSDGGPQPGALRTGSFIAGPDSLGLMFTAPTYLRLDLSLSLAWGQRKSVLSILLPSQVTAAGAPTVDVETDPEDVWAADLDTAVQAAPVVLQAMLPSLRLPLSQLLSLKVGDTIDLAPNVLSEIVVQGGTSGLTCPGRGRRARGIALTARLGQMNGQRAIKLTDLPGPPGRPTPEMELPAPAMAGGQPAIDPLAPQTPKATDPSAGGMGPAGDLAQPMDLDLPDMDLDLPDLPDIPPLS